MEASNGSVVEICELEANGSGWQVRVYNDGELVRDRIPLVDPFTSSENAELSWYLEKYATQDPFESQRANAVAASLERYAEQLLAQLSITNLWNSRDGPFANDAHSLKIYVRSASKDSGVTQEGSLTASNKDSIHRLKWELLETPDLWPPSITSVTVVRLSCGASDELGDEEKPVDLAPVQETCSLPLGEDATINILVVIGRNTQQDATAYEDVDPFVILKCLLSIKRQLRLQQSQIRMNIEVVRPGTFKALGAHLESTTAKSGPGFYHLCHFDLHGRVAYLKDRVHPGKRVRTAFLRFSSSNSWEAVKDIPAQEVAELLHTHGIRTAVLNACQSARADEGVNANLSETFVRNGVGNVLALSFKMVSDAVPILSQTFYEELVLHRRRFSEACVAVRRALRADGKRAARFGFEVDLVDWIIPVVYSSGQDLQITSPQHSVLRSLDDGAKQGEGREKTITKQKLPPEASQVGTSAVSSEAMQIAAYAPPEDLGSLPPWPLGRDYDILRLEQRLVEARVLFTHGPAGSGKTTLIDHILQLWHETNFIERYLHMDLSNPGLSNWPLWGELIGKSLRGDRAPPIQEIGDIFSDITSHNSCVVLDSIQYVYGTNPSDTQLAIRSNVSSFLERLLRDHQKQRTPTQLLVILIGRSGSEKWWQGHFDNLGGSLFSLGDPGLLGAELMCEGMMHDQGVSASEIDSQDLEFLSHIIELLQRNPLASSTALSGAIDGKLRLKDLFESLLCGNYTLPGQLTNTLASPQNSSFIGDLQSLIEEISHDSSIMNAILCLAPCWHTGPPDVDKYIDTISTQLEIEIDTDIFDSVVRRLDDVGALTFAEGRISWIHPMFNLLLSHHIQKSPPGLREEIELALLTFIGDDDMIDPFGTIMQQHSQTHLDEDLAALYFVALWVFQMLAKQIPPAAEGLWTCGLVCTLPHKAGVVLSPPKQRLLLSFIERAVLRYRDQYPDYRCGPHTHSGVWNLVNFINNYYARTRGFGDATFRRFTMIGLELLRSVESALGPIHGFDKVHKNWTYRYQAFMLLHEGKELEADRAWEAGQDFDFLSRTSGSEEADQLGVSVSGSFSQSGGETDEQGSRSVGPVSDTRLDAGDDDDDEEDEEDEAIQQLLVQSQNVSRSNAKVLAQFWADVKQNYREYEEGNVHKLFQKLLDNDQRPSWLDDGSFDEAARGIDKLGLGDVGVPLATMDEALDDFTQPRNIMAALERERDVGDDQNAAQFASILGMTWNDRISTGPYPRYDLLTSLMQGSSSPWNTAASEPSDLLARLGQFMTKQSERAMDERASDEELHEYLALTKEAVDQIGKTRGAVHANMLQNVLDVCGAGPSQLSQESLQKAHDGAQSLMGEHGAEALLEAVRLQAQASELARRRQVSQMIMAEAFRASASIFRSALGQGSEGDDQRDQSGGCSPQ